MRKLLLLAGTGEARDLMQALHRDATIELTVSYPAPPRVPAEGIDWRAGGFGGSAGLRAHLDEHGFDAVIDATHPFAREIPHRAARICAEAGVAHVRLLRAPWQPRPGDRWSDVADAQEAARLIAPGEVVFVASGRETLEPLRHCGAQIICRQLEPPTEAFPFENGSYLLGTPPFSVEDEVQLLRRLRVDQLMIKNAGGTGSRAKLDAAHELGLRVLMLRRPPAPQGARLLSQVEEVLQWAATL